MPGMFYSLKETAQKLGTTEDQVKLLVRDGKLREFRDGSNLLFKIEEVNGLLAENVDMSLTIRGSRRRRVEPRTPADEQPAEALEEAAPLLGRGPVQTRRGRGPALEPMGDVESTSELGLAPEETATDETAAGDDDLLFLADDAIRAETDAAAEVLADSGELDYRRQPGRRDRRGLSRGHGRRQRRRNLPGRRVRHPGRGQQHHRHGHRRHRREASTSSANRTPTSTSPRTRWPRPPSGPPAPSAEASLEEIEDDVNLDSFGSGSGLLDLSLQADDTSLGGILDEIYTSEGGEAAEGAGRGRSLRHRARRGGRRGLLRRHHRRGGPRRRRRRNARARAGRR